MMSPEKRLFVAMLEDRVTRARQRHGADWPRIVAEWEPRIRLMMSELGTDNPLFPAVRFSKAMKDKGECPNLFIAACAELAIREGSAASN